MDTICLPQNHYMSTPRNRGEIDHAFAWRQRDLDLRHVGDTVYRYSPAIELLELICRFAADPSSNQPASSLCSSWSSNPFFFLGRTL